MNAASCRYPGSEKECAAAKCENAVASGRSVCDGQGSCPGPSVSSCAPNQCDGTICGGGCSAAQPCSGQQYCEAGRCTPKKAAGEKCVDATSCSSGHCVDGNCCDAACDGACQTCSAPGSAGHCKSVTSADDDHCSGVSTCDAQGACKKRAGADCGSSGECATGACVDGKCCISSSCGTCQACTGGGGVCVDVIGTSDPDTCAQPKVCVGAGACKKASGTDCGTATECATGACVDGKCCQSPACGVCQACTGAGGTCAKVASGSDPDSCMGTCDSSGMCKKAQGETCMSGGECLLGVCADGKCCDRSCSGTCESCATGTCEVVANGSDPDSCAGQCSALGACVAAVKRVTAANIHTCALLSTGAVRCWGAAISGRLGYGNQTDRNSPGPDVNVGGKVVVPAQPSWVSLVAGGNHTCAVLESGALRCWGSANYGQLGYGTKLDVSVPAGAGDVMVGGTVSQIAAGVSHTCGVLPMGAVRCWGQAYYGALGYPNLNGNDIGDTETPASMPALSITGTVTQIAAGDYHTCVLLDTGAVRCWGQAAGGKLGYGNTSDRPDASQVGNIAVGGIVKQIAAGNSHTCALLNAGTVRCWGDGLPLGYGNLNTIGDDELPSTAGDVMVGGQVTQITAGTFHTCALLSTGTVRCWGKGTYGSLGYGNKNDIGDNETPASAGDVPVGGTVTHIAAGGRHTCAVMGTGKLRCWGDGSSGQLGYGNNNSIGDDETPASAGDVPGLQ